MIKLGIVMDPIANINIKKDSSFAMLLEAQRRGYELIAATLRFQQHGEAGIFLDVNVCDGVHHDAELDHVLLR